MKTCENIKSKTRTLSWTVSAADIEAFSAFSIKKASRESSGKLSPTVELFLRTKGCSHRVLTHLKRTDHGILLNGTWAYGNQQVHEQDIVTIHLKENETSGQIIPVPLPLAIVYEDDDLLIVDKPSNMPVHPSIGNYGNTLANAVMYYYSSRGIPFVFRCATRLDRDTTGLVILAKNMLSSAVLSDLSVKGRLHREYLAITEGRLPVSGTIDAPIARKENSVLMRCVDPDHGERAITHFRTLAYYEKKQQDLSVLPSGLSLASVLLETGRTHQIRVHMKFIGHPLPGDFLYYPETICDLAPRQMLHAHRISFSHPITGKELSFESELPSDMKRLLNAYERTDRIK